MSMKNETERGRTLTHKQKTYHLFTDVFSIPRNDLAQALHEMQTEIFEEKHCVPISKMGDFQTAVNTGTYRNAYLEPDMIKNDPVNFGNPFKKPNSMSDASALSMLDDNPNLVMPRSLSNSSDIVYIHIKRPKGY